MSRVEKGSVYYRHTYAELVTKCNQLKMEVSTIDIH